MADGNFRDVKKLAQGLTGNSRHRRMVRYNVNASFQVFSSFLLSLAVV